MDIRGSFHCSDIPTARATLHTGQMNTTFAAGPVDHLTTVENPGLPPGFLTSESRAGNYPEPLSWSSIRQVDDGQIKSPWRYKGRGERFLGNAGPRPASQWRRAGLVQQPGSGLQFVLKSFLTSQLDFTHFKWHKRGNLQVDGIERPGVPEYLRQLQTVKNLPRQPQVAPRQSDGIHCFF